MTKALDAARTGALCTERLPWETLLLFSQATGQVFGRYSFSHVWDMGRISAQSNELFFFSPCPNNVVLRVYAKPDFMVDEGKERPNPFRVRSQGKPRRRKVKKYS